MTSPYLTPKAAAEYVLSTENTLAQYRSEKRGPAYIKRGNRVVYTLADLDAWMQANRVEAP
jgi:hypothetical protein